jgi:ABC-2 type transport system ATP-binding protein
MTGIGDLETVPANELRIYERTNQTGEINRLLVQRGITVESIAVSEQRLEEYFVNLTGGVKQ